MGWGLGVAAHKLKGEAQLWHCFLAPSCPLWVLPRWDKLGVVDAGGGTLGSSGRPLNNQSPIGNCAGKNSSPDVHMNDHKMCVGAIKPQRIHGRVNSTSVPSGLPIMVPCTSLSGMGKVHLSLLLFAPFSFSSVC